MGTVARQYAPSRLFLGSHWAVSGVGVRTARRRRQERPTPPTRDRQIARSLKGVDGAAKGRGICARFLADGRQGDGGGLAVDGAEHIERQPRRENGMERRRRHGAALKAASRPRLGRRR